MQKCKSINLDTKELIFSHTKTQEEETAITVWPISSHPKSDMAYEYGPTCQKAIEVITSTYQAQE